jgi:hypothetical protein
MALVGIGDETPTRRVAGSIASTVASPASSTNAAAPFRLAAVCSAAGTGGRWRMRARTACATAAPASRLRGFDRLALNVAQDLIDADAFQVRVYAFVTAYKGSPLLDFPGNVRTGFGDARLRIGAFKLVADGSAVPSAATRAPWPQSRDSGILPWTQEGVDGLLGRAHRLGWGVGARRRRPRH